MFGKPAAIVAAQREDRRVAAAYQLGIQHAYEHVGKPLPRYVLVEHDDTGNAVVVDTVRRIGWPVKGAGQLKEARRLFPVVGYAFEDAAIWQAFNLGRGLEKDHPGSMEVAANYEEAAAILDRYDP